MRTPIKIKEPVHIPDESGKIRETVWVEVDAEKDEDGEIYFSGVTLTKLDRIKARHMGILLPRDLKAMRERLRLTQRQMAELLGCGDKSYSRWETGAERPSQSTNKLLVALNEGRISIDDLRPITVQDAFSWTKVNPTVLVSVPAEIASSIIDMPLKGEPCDESSPIAVAT